MKLPERESDILKACKTLLDYKGVWYFRSNAIPVPLPGGGFRRFTGKKGIPDLIAVLPPHGQLWGIEVKTPTGRASPEQLAVHAELLKLGAVVSVVRSVEELQADLSELGL